MAFLDSQDIPPVQQPGSNFDYYNKTIQLLKM